MQPFCCIRHEAPCILSRKGGGAMKHYSPDVDDLIFGEEEYYVSER